MGIHTSYMDKRRRVIDLRTISASPVMKAMGLNTTKGNRYVNFWPLTDRLEQRKRGFLQRVKWDRLREERVPLRLQEIGKSLMDLIDMARKRGGWPGARLLAVDDELVLVFGQQVGRPTEIARVTVWGLDARTLRNPQPLPAHVTITVEEEEERKTQPPRVYPLESHAAHFPGERPMPQQAHDAAPKGKHPGTVSLLDEAKRKRKAHA